MNTIHCMDTRSRVLLLLQYVVYGICIRVQEEKQEKERETNYERT
jgi:hypothetical protein